MGKRQLMNKGKGKKVMALFLVMCFVALSGPLIARERQGAKVKVLGKNGEHREGELIAVKQNSILVLSSSRVDEALSVTDIKLIEIKKETRATAGVIGVVVGILAGGGAGALIGGGGNKGEGLAGLSNSIRGGTQGLVFGALVGGLIGGMTASQVGAYEKLQIEGKSPEAVKAGLEKLRSRARVPDAQ